jgi:hypothetical protein
MVGWVIGSTKGRHVDGALLGALLGPIGWIITATTKPTVEFQAKKIAETQRAQALAMSMNSPPTSQPTEAPAGFYWDGYAFRPNPPGWRLEAGSWVADTEAQGP